jgi:hypothetical protein
MADATVRYPWDSALQLLGSTLPDWLDDYNARRLAAYQLYEDIYWNHPDTFKLVMRGETDVPPLYIPAGRVICNTMNRYAGRGWNWKINPAVGTSNAQDVASQFMTALFARERVLSKFNTNKLYGIIRGDAAWYISGDPAKPQGSRLKISTIHPGKVFWIYNPDDDEEVWGVDIVEQAVNGDDTFVKRQRYLKSQHPDNPFGGEVPGGNISYQIDSFETDGWQSDTDRKTYSAGPSAPPLEITGITTLPIYAWKNFEADGEEWGRSEMSGIERLFGGINQAITDEDLALALQGLGLYYTDSGAPVDEDGNEVPWQLGPGQVVEVADGKKFARVDGVTTVEASLNHIHEIQDQIYRVQGASDVAQGRVDTTMAESGIALQLRMGPILDEAGIKDQLINDCMNQMLYDLQFWARAYEGEDLSTVSIVSQVGPKLPEDQAAWITTLLNGYNAIPPLWSGGYVRDELRRMGHDIPPNQIADILAEQEALSAVGVEGTDTTGQRLDAEAGAANDES